MRNVILLQPIDRPEAVQVYSSIKTLCAGNSDFSYGSIARFGKRLSESEGVIYKGRYRIMKKQIQTPDIIHY